MVNYKKCSICKIKKGLYISDDLKVWCYYCGRQAPKKEYRKMKRKELEWYKRKIEVWTDDVRIIQSRASLEIKLDIIKNILDEKKSKRYRLVLLGIIIGMIVLLSIF